VNKKKQKNFDFLKHLARLLQIWRDRKFLLFFKGAALGVIFGNGVLGLILFV
jgi:hypothetical protein